MHVHMAEHRGGWKMTTDYDTCSILTIDVKLTRDVSESK